MLKKEILWREILYQAIEHKKTEFTQKDLATKFSFSLSTVFNALKIPRQAGAIKVTGKNFRVVDSEKFLYIWATHRSIEKEKIYETYTGKSVQETEGMMPPEIIFGCYSAYTKRYQDAPADYDKVHIYSDRKNLINIKERFPKKKGEPNLFVLQADPLLKNFGWTTPDVQTFADIWNLKEWYAKDFLNAVKKKLSL